jgi:hypothetical protein
MDIVNSKIFLGEEALSQEYAFQTEDFTFEIGQGQTRSCCTPQVYKI